MKRIIAALLAGLCLFALVGCSAGSKADSAAPKDYSQIIHDARTDEDNEYDMIFTRGEDGKFTAIDGYSAEYEADQLNDELKDMVFPLLGLEDGSYESFAASVSSMMVRSFCSDRIWNTSFRSVSSGRVSKLMENAFRKSFGSLWANSRLSVIIRIPSA